MSKPIYTEAEERSNARWSGWKDWLFLPPLLLALTILFVIMLPVWFLKRIGAFTIKTTLTPVEVVALTASSLAILLCLGGAAWLIVKLI
jgi:hypothetical protein